MKRGTSITTIAIMLLAMTGVAQAQFSPNSELQLPAKAPIGWVLVIHGGGWQAVGKSAVKSVRANAAFFRAHGWGTYNIDYRKGIRSLPDVLSAYDALRRNVVGPRVPICVWGGSAGGNLALLLAARRKRVACVITEGAPTDLTRFTSEPAYGTSPEAGPNFIKQTGILPSFGGSPQSLWRWSPVRVARHIRARLLLGASSTDPYVPQQQMAEMQYARPANTTTMLLPGSSATPTNFTHASITPSALACWHQAELRLLASL